MRALTLGEVLQLAELATGLPAEILAVHSRVDVLDSALHAPFIGFGEQDVYPSFELKAAVLCSRIVRNHSLPDGNKRLGWLSLALFCDINNYDLVADPSQAIALFVMIASSEVSELEISGWISRHIRFRISTVSHTPCV